MGVPAFFRWLTTRYPKVVIDALSVDDLEVFAEEFKNDKKNPSTNTDPNEIDLDGGEDDSALRIASTNMQKSKELELLEQKVKNNNPQVDNLYLDMNGIIHPCARPQQNGGAPVGSEQEIFDNIYAYTDKILRIVKPQKVLYLAIDGVAPKAKLN